MTQRSLKYRPAILLTACVLGLAGIVHAQDIPGSADPQTSPFAYQSAVFDPGHWSQDNLLPAPPQYTLDPSVGEWCVVIFLAFVVLLLLYALFNLHTEIGRLIPLLLAGAAMTWLCEPILDCLGGAWYPYAGQILFWPSTVPLAGHPLPLWEFVAYLYFYAFQGAITIWLFMRGIKKVHILWLFVGAMIGDVVLQELLNEYHLMFYYGNQPLRLFLFPLWWPPCDAISTLFAASVCFLMIKHMKKPLGVWRYLLIPVAYPICDFIGYGGTGLVNFTVVNTQLPYWPTQLLGLSSYILVIPFLVIITSTIATDGALTNKLQKLAEA